MLLPLLLNLAPPRLYAVVAPSAGWVNPDDLQVLAGLDGNGNPATWAGSEEAPTVTTDPFDFAADATGLTPEPSYRIALVWSSGASTSNVAVSAPFSTTSLSVSGTLAATEPGSDTAALSGQIVVSGALSASETGSDTAVLTGAVSVQCLIAAAEAGADAASLSGQVRVSGALSATESDPDTAAINGSSNITTTGTLNVVEAGGDTCAATGQVLVAGLMAAVEGGTDTSAVVGQIIVRGALSAVESGGDTAIILQSPGGTALLSEHWRYDVPAASLRFDIPSIGASLSLS